MAERSVLMLLADGGNNAIRGLMTEYGKALAAAGIPTINISLEPAELQYAVDEMAAGRIHFAVTWLGIAQDVTVQGPGQLDVNCWQHFNVPLVKIHADSPAYFAERHANVPENSANLYMASEFMHFRDTWMPDARSVAALLPPWPMSTIERARVDLKRRRHGKLIFLKNGNPPAELEARWRANLSSPTTDSLLELAGEIRKVGLSTGALHIGDFVGAYFKSRGISSASMQNLVSFFTAQLDDYLRRIKSEIIANALLDFPVIVQGANWNHVDFSGRKAQLRPGQDFETSHRIFTDELGVIDMSPNMDSEPHERMMRAAGAFSAALTNRQSWIEKKFDNAPSFTFDFDPESIRERIASVLENPDRHLEVGIEFGERFRQVYPPEELIRRVTEAAALASLQGRGPKPQIQDFFVWRRS